MFDLNCSLLKAVLGSAVLLSVSQAAPLFDERSFAPQDIITRDVCIIGGGSTGTYSAVRLSQDMGKTVMIVEKTYVHLLSSLIQTDFGVKRCVFT